MLTQASNIDVHYAYEDSQAVDWIMPELIDGIEDQPAAKKPRISKNVIVRDDRLDGVMNDHSIRSVQKNVMNSLGEEIIKGDTNAIVCTMKYEKSIIDGHASLKLFSSVDPMNHEQEVDVVTLCSMTMNSPHTTCEDLFRLWHLHGNDMFIPMVRARDIVNAGRKTRALTVEKEPDEIPDEAPDCVDENDKQALNESIEEKVVDGAKMKTAQVKHFLMLCAMTKLMSYGKLIAAPILKVSTDYLDAYKNRENVPETTIDSIKLDLQRLEKMNVEVLCYQSAR